MDYITRYANNNNTLLETKEMGLSPEIVAVIVFIGIYIVIRLTERFISPIIPMFLFTEIKSLYNWGIFLIPLMVGYASYSNKCTSSDDKELKKRMLSFLKK